MRRRMLISAVALVVLAGIVTILWTVLDWPLPRFILTYGSPPAGGPAGRTMQLKVVREFMDMIVLEHGAFERGFRPVFTVRGGE